MPGGTGHARPILVVDDDPLVLETVRLALEVHGYIAVAAPDGGVALDAVARLRPGLILLDMRMPGLSGWDVARALREGGDPVPVVVMTAASDPTAWAAEVGAADHLVKPFSLAQLVSVVRRWAVGGPEGPARASSGPDWPDGPGGSNGRHGPDRADGPDGPDAARTAPPG